MEFTASDEEFIEFHDILLAKFVTLNVLGPIIHETSTKRWRHIFHFYLLSSYPICRLVVDFGLHTCFI